MRVIPVSCSEGLSNSKGRHTNNDSNMAPGDVWYNCTLPPAAECDMIDDLAGVFQLCALLHFAGTDFKDTGHQHGVYLLLYVWVRVLPSRESWVDAFDQVRDTYICMF